MIRKHLPIARIRGFYLRKVKYTQQNFQGKGFSGVLDLYVIEHTAVIFKIFRPFFRIRREK